MGWLAFDSIEEALQDSKDILLPFDLRVWTLFALIILLTGHLTLGFPSVPFPGDTDTGSDWGDGSAEMTVPETSIQNPLTDQLGVESFVGQATQSPSMSPLLLLLLVLVPGLVLFLIYVTSVFEFVMYRSVKEKEPKIGYYRDYLGKGLQYMAFNLVITAVMFIAVIMAILPLTVTLWSLVAVVPVLLIVFVILGGLNWLVFNIALPEMIYKDENIIAGINRSIEILKTDTREVVLFWLMKWVIGLLIGIAVLTGVFSGLLILAVPFVIVGFLLALIAPVLAIPVGLIYVLLVIALLLYIAVPVRVYLYSYTLNVYEDLVE